MLSQHKNNLHQIALDESDLVQLTDNGETYDVYIMAPDGSNQIRLTFDPADDIIPRWQP